jgi:hypothetical protein
VPAALANINAENPTDPALIALGTLALLLAFNSFMLLVFFASVLPRVRKLNALWQGGKLLVSQHVEIGRPRDSKAQHATPSRRLTACYAERKTTTTSQSASAPKRSRSC